MSSNSPDTAPRTSPPSLPESGPENLSASFEDAIRKATARCFHTPGASTLAALESLLTSRAAQKDRAPDPRVPQPDEWVLQAANAALEDEARQLAEIFQAQGTPFVCKAGCTGCCRQMVLCQPFESRAIQRFLEAHPPLLERFRAAYPVWDKATAPMRQSYLDWAQRRYGQGEDTGSHTLGDYQAICPFLNAAGRCDIYPVRPYGCRTCVALAPVCAEPCSGQYGAWQMQFSLYTTHHATRMAVTRVLLRQLHLDASPVPLPERVAALCRLDKEEA